MWQHLLGQIKQRYPAALVVLALILLLLRFVGFIPSDAPNDAPLNRQPTALPPIAPSPPPVSFGRVPVISDAASVSSTPLHSDTLMFDPAVQTAPLFEQGAVDVYPDIRAFFDFVYSPPSAAALAWQRQHPHYEALMEIVFEHDNIPLRLSYLVRYEQGQPVYASLEHNLSQVNIIAPRPSVYMYKLSNYEAAYNKNKNAPRAATAPQNAHIPKSASNSAFIAWFSFADGRSRCHILHHPETLLFASDIGVPLRMPNAVFQRLQDAAQFQDGLLQGATTTISYQEAQSLGLPLAVHEAVVRVFIRPASANAPTISPPLACDIAAYATPFPLTNEYVISFTLESAADTLTPSIQSMMLVYPDRSSVTNRSYTEFLTQYGWNIYRQASFQDFEFYYEAAREDKDAVHTLEMRVGAFKPDRRHAFVYLAVRKME